MKKQRHFDELQLINLVKEQPAIYDRKSKDYRRPGITENAWSSIAEKLGVAKVEEVKKRWKSLRDAFIKYYRQELTTGKPFGNKKKGWPFYHQLSYLRQHVELLGLDNLEPPELYDEAKMETTIIEDTTQHQQRMADVSLEFENDTVDPEEIEIIDDTDKIQKLLDEHHKQEYLEHRNVESKGGRCSSEQDISTSMVVVDPDERYLLSCLPVLKRLPSQKNALIKLKIQQLLYEVEFEMNEESHSTKKRRVN